MRQNVPRRLGQLLRRRREERSLSVAEMAHGVCVTGPAITFWEKSRSKPAPERLPDISAQLQIPLEELVKVGRYMDEIKAANINEVRLLLSFRKLGRRDQGAILRSIQERHMAQ